MKFGASTACYYPLETEKALQRVIDGGFQSTEIFFNTSTELRETFLHQLADIANGQTEIRSIHPFSSFAETTCLFGNYERRVEDTLEFYKRYMNACNILGASVLVLHGAIIKAKTIVSFETYIERFHRLCEIGKTFGVTVAQENVVNHFSESPDFLIRMKKELGDDFKMVFDIKQAVRAGVDPFCFVNEFARDIVHIHISDHNGEQDCIPPGKGNFDFKRLVGEMDKAHYAGHYEIEIYSEQYQVFDELRESRLFLSKI